MNLDARVSLLSSLVLFLLVGNGPWVLPAIAQANRIDGWIQPYAEKGFTDYWEHLDSSGFGGQQLFAGPRIDAFAAVRESVNAGERVALLAVVPILINGNFQGIGAFIGDLAEVRFVGADSSGVTLEIRRAPYPGTGGTGVENVPCNKTPLDVYFHRPDWRYQLLESCMGSTFPIRPGPRWSEWQQLRFPLKGSYVVKVTEESQRGLLPLSLAVNQSPLGGGRLLVTVSR